VLATYTDSPPDQLKGAAGEASGGLGAQGSKIQLKKTKAAKPRTHNSEGKKIQLYSFLEAVTAAYVSSTCFFNLSGSNRCRL
jgi:hypothetical protein